MEMAAKKEYIEVMRKRYTACKKKEEKSVVIEETRMVLKVHRKSVIRILNGKQRKKRNSVVIHTPDLIAPLKLMWE